MERRNKILKYGLFFAISIFLVMWMVWILRENSLEVDIPYSFLKKIEKEAEKGNLFSYLKGLQTGEKLSKEELYGYEEEETLKELFQLEEKKRKEYSTEYWKLDLEQDGIEDLVQIQQGSGWVESVCFYDGQKEGGFVRSYVENRREDNIQEVMFLSYKGKTYYALLRPAEERKNSGMDIVEVYPIEQGKLKKGIGIQTKWKELKVIEEEYEEESYQELIERLKEKEREYIAYMNGDKNVIVGEGEEEIGLPEGIEENKKSKEYEGWYKSDLNNDGDMEYYQKEKKGFSKEQIQYEKELEVNLFLDGKEKSLEKALHLRYYEENIRMKTFWVEKVKGKNIVCILKREKKGEGKGITIDCYITKGEKTAERVARIRYEGIPSGVCKWEEKEGEKKGYYIWEEPERNATGEEIKIIQIGGLEEKEKEERINEVIYESIMSLEREGYEANFKGRVGILYRTDRYLCLKVEGEEIVEYPRKLNSSGWSGWKKERNTQKMYLLIDIKEGKRLRLEEVIKMEEFAEGLEKEEIPIIDEMIDTFRLIITLREWTEEEIREELRECNIGEKEYLEEKGEKKYTMKNQFFITEGRFYLLFEAYEETAVVFRWEDIEEYLKIELEEK